MKQRLINCDFINAMSVSNKAKLLYVYMFVNADDLGFVSNVSNIITLLTSNEGENISLELLNNDYNSALSELGNMGLLYKFTDRHGNSAYLIRHWFIHNKWKKDLRTNYFSFRALVRLEDYEYHLKESSKESTLRVLGAVFSTKAELSPKKTMPLPLGTPSPLHSLGLRP